MNNFGNYFFYILITLFLITSCTSNSNDAEFLKKVEGRYLYNSDEIIKVYASEDNKLLIDWRGAEGIIPLKTDENTFFVKEMNEKIQFLTNPADQKLYLVFVPKEDGKASKYVYVKVSDTLKLPSEYLAEGNFEKALEGYLTIKEKDSLSPIIDSWKLNRMGYDYIQKNNLEMAITIFKLNVALHPKKSNGYDSLAEAYQRNKDTANAMINYKKALQINPDSRRAKGQIEKLQGKQLDKTN